MPEFQDRVRHKTSANKDTGVVIAKYKGTDGIWYLDVRSDDDRIFYETPAENWEVTKEYKG